MEENENIINTEEVTPVEEEIVQEESIETETIEEHTDTTLEEEIAEADGEENASSEEISQEVVNTEVKKKRRRRRRKIDEYTLENDIKYRGPLSYRWLRILAWLFLIISQIGVLLALGSKLDSGLANKVGDLPDLMSGAKDIMMPLFLVATFATILNGSRTFKSMLIVYGGGAIIFYILFILFHERYVAGLIAWAMQIDRSAAVELIDGLLSMVKSGYLAFNIFIDLFLVTLLTFFLVYKPKKIFVGKKLVWFRFFAIIPIAYEVASFTLKMLGALGTMTVSPYLFALLTTKPPMTFIVFLGIAIFIKVRGRIYKKRGKTPEQYSEFLKTKANSWQFSKYLALFMFIAGIIDLIIHIILLVGFAAIAIGIEEDADTIAQVLTYVSAAMTKAGIGESYPLIVASPIILFFSYTRTHKNTRFDMFIPILAIIALIFVYLEAMMIAIKMVGTPEALIQKIVGA